MYIDYCISDIFMMNEMNTHVLGRFGIGCIENDSTKNVGISLAKKITP